MGNDEKTPLKLMYEIWRETCDALDKEMEIKIATFAAGNEIKAGEPVYIRAADGKVWGGGE